jgi:hypothetical protein
MVRALVGSVLMVTVMASPVFAADGTKAGDPVAPSAAVAQAWKKEAPKASSAVRALFVSYGAVEALDMVSTIKARQAGAMEANPMMTGSYAKGIAMKAALGAVTMLAARKLEKKNKVAAIATMVAVNVATAAVVAHNMHVNQQLAK